MKSLKGLLIIFVCLLAGGILRQIIPLPIPDVVYGMLVLFVLFSINIVKVEDVEKTSDALLENLGLLFVPLSVSLITKFDLLSSNLVKIMIIIFITTFITMGVTAKVVEMVEKLGGKHDR
ncbi:hypothetical protein HMPREF9709_00226 [Helcococcus kunzii ATCC 51366]|uniref:Antiholin-like protein LrgA n=1 Tax=Helcococcus kunzii ATCC 51366 TaxID=883114 RepID=H3NLL5_9FIRM|nr:CidA/LrgA family protein [Helcococcus kunzii]EHR35780.1 hypothetical protein HMPREF9709_00226 [Helcococcus kunzii ATCC 51366]